MASMLLGASGSGNTPIIFEDGPMLPSMSIGSLPFTFGSDPRIYV